ncbi:hypothetical protein BH09PAT1_BH09PAT1_7180 [soil metagenome]
MPKLFSKYIVLLLIVLFVYAATAAYHSYTSGGINKPSVEGVTTKATVPTNTTEASVIKVVDGDTLSVKVDGKKQTIRIIGIDTPETVDPRKPVQCFGVAASNRAKQLLSGQTVYLESDPTQGNTDKYARLLRYVWLNNQDYGLTTIADGYAHEYTYDIPYKYQKKYKQAQNNAMQQKLGLWGDNACNQPTPTSVSLQKPSPSAGRSANLEGGTVGPDKDCKDFSTHTEAQNYFIENGGNAERDFDGLDPDHDGQACESLP